jgi:hypothetical protein
VAFRLRIVFVLASLAAAVPAGAWFGTPSVAVRPLPGDGSLTGKAVPGPPPPPVAPPHPSGSAVIELLEDDGGRLARALNPGQDHSTLGKAGAWAADRFSGATCLKVAGYQRYRETVAGWAYPVVEKPRPGEYRYLRFAWKKPDGRGIMLQLCADGAAWGKYYAGSNTVGFSPALQLSPQVPRDWQVVTRDLFADFGRVPFTLTGIAFTPMDGVALFDHVYLGRSIGDLDRVTNAAAEWSRKTDFPRPAQLDRWWKDASGADAAVRQPAVFALGACGGSSVPYIAERLTVPDPADARNHIARAIGDLDAARFAVREQATRELERFGPTALPALEAALKRDNLSPEWRTRLEKLAAGIRGEMQVLTPDQRQTLTAIHVLELAGTAGAKELLQRLANAELEAGLSGEAKAAAERMGRSK